MAHWIYCGILGMKISSIMMFPLTYWHSKDSPGPNTLNAVIKAVTNLSICPDMIEKLYSVLTTNSFNI